MLWTVSPCLLLFTSFFMNCVSAGKQCREERSIHGMALQGFIFKKFLVRAFHECDVSCETEITCQSYNYVLKEKSCELNYRTKEARPEHFRSDQARFYIRRLNERGMYNNLKSYRVFRGEHHKKSHWGLGRGSRSTKHERKNINFQLASSSFKTSVLRFALNA